MPFRAAFVVDSIPALMRLLAAGVDALAARPVDSSESFAAIGHAPRERSAAPRASTAGQTPAADASGLAALAASARAWLAGEAMADMPSESGTAPRRVAIPTYPFQDRPIWPEPPGSPGSPARAEGAAAPQFVDPSVDPFDALFFETFAEPAERRSAPPVGAS